MFRTVVADPPWPYRDSGVRGGTGRHYSTMSLEDIKNLPVPEVAADNAHLYLWVTAAFLPVAFDVLKAWGFRHITPLVWVKCTQAGEPAMGVGHYFRHSVEYLLFGVRGRLSLQVKDQRTVFFARRRQHSQKPKELYAVVERCSPGPYLELFARDLRGGWSVWGNEVSPTDMGSLAVAKIFDKRIKERACRSSI